MATTDGKNLKPTIQNSSSIELGKTNIKLSEKIDVANDKSDLLTDSVENLTQASLNLKDQMGFLISDLKELRKDETQIDGRQTFDDRINELNSLRTSLKNVLNNASKIISKSNMGEDVGKDIKKSMAEFSRLSSILNATLNAENWTEGLLDDVNEKDARNQLKASGKVLSDTFESLKDRQNLIKETDSKFLDNLIGLTSALRPLKGIAEDLKEQRKEGRMAASQTLDTMSATDDVASKKLEAKEEAKQARASLRKTQMKGQAMVALGAATKYLNGLLKDTDKLSGEIMRNFSMSRAESMQMIEDYANGAGVLDNFGSTVKTMAETHDVINKAMGTQSQYSSELLVTTDQLIQRNKLSAEAATNFAMQLQATNGSAKELETSQFKILASLQNESKIRLNNNAILDEANKISGQLRVNLLRSPEGLVKAVAQAKLLGVEMSSVKNMAGSLLDFEGSINKELEAELLLGKDINLERARSLALQGKSDEAVKSMISQVGTLKEFQQLNVLQQQSLAGAIGMSTDELALSLEKQAAINNSKEKGLNLDAEALKTNAKAMSVQETIAAAIDKIGVALSLVLPLMIGLAAAATVASLAMTGGLSAGWILGGAAVAGLAMGGASAYMMNDGMISSPSSSKSQRMFLDEGQITAFNPNDNVSIVAGTNMTPTSNTTTTTSQDNRETNNLLRKILNKEGNVNMNTTKVGTAFSMSSYSVQ